MLEDIIIFIKELQIKLSPEQEALILEQFTDKSSDVYNAFVYWYIDVDCRKIKFFFEGIITKQDYEKIKTPDEKCNIYFGEISKHSYANAELNELQFSEDKDQILAFEKSNKRDYFDFVEFLHEQEKLKD